MHRRLLTQSDTYQDSYSINEDITDKARLYSEWYFPSLKIDFTPFLGDKDWGKGETPDWQNLNTIFLDIKKEESSSYFHYFKHDNLVVFPKFTQRHLISESDAKESIIAKLEYVSD